MFPASLGLLTNVHFCVHTFFARHLVWPVCKKALPGRDAFTHTRPKLNTSINLLAIRPYRP